MKLKILISGHLVRHPVGGHTWHHLQYLAGLIRLGHDVAFLEHWGWSNSCYDASRDEITADPSFGLGYFRAALDRCGISPKWCFVPETGSPIGMSLRELSEWCRTCDVYLNLSNMNWMEEVESCRLRVLVDTDPVFTQIGAHGVADPVRGHHVLFSYGENIGRNGCTVPTGGASWLPTRQPVVMELWPVFPGNAKAPWTSIMNWSAYGDHHHDGRIYGQKDREFEPYFDLPRRSGLPMELAVSAPAQVKRRLVDGGWKIVSPQEAAGDPQAYQAYLRGSRGEWCVAKHAYVSTRSGWFSDRSAGYLASGRPVVLQDTGFSDFLPCGKGLLTYSSPEGAMDELAAVRADYSAHCRAAREIAEAHFDSDRVLTELLERAQTRPRQALAEPAGAP